MNTFDMILEEMIKSGQIPRSMMGPQKNKTWVDLIADKLDARTQLVTQAKQAKMPGTPSERQQLNFGPNPTQGPLATPAGIPSINPQVGTPAGEVNRYAQPASNFDKFASSLGTAADITGNQALSNAANLASVAKFMMK